MAVIVYDTDMNSFNRHGVFLQKYSVTAEEAKMNMAKSCKICRAYQQSKCLDHDCSRCPINAEHKTVMDVFEDLAIEYEVYKLRKSTMTVTNLDERTVVPPTTKRGKKKFATLKISVDPCSHCKGKICVQPCSYKRIHIAFIKEVM
jgi:hypothetical protein